MTIWIFSDPHFSHENIIQYCNRPFKNAAEMDEAMVERINSVVKPQDHLYCLGDVVMRRKQLAIVRRLNGHKRLVCGNHDIFDTKEYMEAGFKKIMAYRVMDNVILSHIPIHVESMGRFTGNVHGHLHDRAEYEGSYYNVSVERINYTPVTLEEAKEKLLKR